MIIASRVQSRDCHDQVEIIWAILEDGRVEFWRREKEGEEEKNGEAEVNAWILRLRILIVTCILRHVNEKR